MGRRRRGSLILGSLSTRVFETRTATGSELFFLLTCLDTTTFISPSIFPLLDTLSLKGWERPLSWRAKYSLPVEVRVSKTRVLKLPIINSSRAYTFKISRYTPLVNATLMAGRRRGTLLTALLRFTCCSSELLQLFMTEIVALHITL